MFPENIVQATFQQVQTNYIPARPKVMQRIGSLLSNGTVTSNVSDSTLMKPILEYTNEVNVLGSLCIHANFYPVLLQV